MERREYELYFIPKDFKLVWLQKEIQNNPKYLGISFYGEWLNKQTEGKCSNEKERLSLMNKLVLDVLNLEINNTKYHSIVKEIDLGFTKVSLSNIASYPVLRNLKVVSLFKNKKVTDEVFCRFLYKTPNLEEINISETELSLSNVDSWPNLPKLKKMNLQSCKNISDQNLLNLLHKYSNSLEILFLGNGLGFSKYSFSNATSYPSLPRLKTIALQFSDQLTDMNTRYILGKCPNIEEVYLDFIYQLTLSDFADNWPNILQKVKKIHITKRKDNKYYEIIKSELLRLLHKCLPTIEEVDLTNSGIESKKYCKKLSKSEIIAFLEEEKSLYQPKRKQKTQVTQFTEPQQNQPTSIQPIQQNNKELERRETSLLQKEEQLKKERELLEKERKLIEKEKSLSQRERELKRREEESNLLNCCKIT